MANMPAPASTFTELATGQYSVLSVAAPGARPENAGILLIDPAADRAYLRFRPDLAAMAGADDEEYLEALAGDLERKAGEAGARALLDWLEGNASNFIRVTDREPVAVDSFDRTLARLYRRHVTPKVLPFRTHLPLYAAEAAAGSWGRPMEAGEEPEEWLEVPGLRLTPDMFAAHVTGRSMEPRIPDGAVCVFRGGAAVAGSRQGKLVLVANYGEPGENRFTVKRYRSVKAVGEDGEWAHEKIILEPLNPEFESWELREGDRIRVLGEFVAVVPG